MQRNNEMQKIIKSFFEAGVVQISTNPLFKLASGAESPVYLDHRKIWSFPELRRSLIKVWSEKLESDLQISSNKKNIAFVGTATAGIAPAYALAEIFGCTFAYVRSKAKEHGSKSMIEGVLPASAQVIVVEDMVTTGGSALQAVRHIREGAYQVLGVVTISKHDLKKTQENFVNSGTTLFKLFNTTDIFDIAYALQLISGKELKLIMEWLNNLNA